MPQKIENVAKIPAAQAHLFEEARASNGMQK